MGSNPNFAASGKFNIQVTGEFTKSATITVNVLKSGDPSMQGEEANPSNSRRLFEVESDNPDILVSPVWNTMQRDSTPNPWYVIVVLNIWIKNIPPYVRLGSKSFNRICTATRFNSYDYSAAGSHTYDTCAVQGVNTPYYNEMYFRLQINECNLNIRDCSASHGANKSTSIATMTMNFVDNYSPVRIHRNGVWQPYRNDGNGYIYQYSTSDNKWHKVKKVYKRVNGQWKLMLDIVKGG